jgi:glycosyltransferase involved in cell wall biosynthesis
VLENKSVALVHEWFSANGGSENVFLALNDLIAHATSYVLWRDRAATRGADFKESWLGRTPLRRSKAFALPVMPLAWRTLTRKHYDVVISSTHAFAHTVRTGSAERTRFLSYVHSPARYIWSPDFDGRGSSRALSVPRRLLQAVDVRMSRHVDSYAANSREVQARIKRFWKRDSYVVNPPVDISYFADAPMRDRQQDRRYLLGFGRWIPYKNFDLIIEVADRARLPLVIAGSGPEEVALRRLAARANIAVTFEVRPSQDRLRTLYWGASALLFPVHEDFGIVPVEAQACGTPVVGLRRGGLLETVVDGETGVLVDSRDPEDYVSPIKLANDMDRSRIMAHSWRFSTEVFRQKVASWIAEQPGGGQ